MVSNPDERSYWERRQARQPLWPAIRRRRFLGGAGLGATGLASWAMVGCGDDDDDTDPATTAAGTTETATQADATSTVRASAGEVKISQASLDTQPGDPHAGTSGIQEPIRIGQGTTLYYTDINGEVKPGVAEAIEFAADGMSYNVRVRQGITFTNGDALSAEDVQFSIDRMVQVSASKALYAAFVDRTELVDESNVKVFLKSVAPAFVFSLRGIYTVPKAYSQSLNDGDFAANEFAKAPIGVGPYKLVQNEIGSHLLFEAYDNFFLGTPRVRRIRVAAVPELTTRIAQLQTGEVDIIAGVLADHIKTIQDIRGAQIARSEGSGSSELTYFDMMDPASPFHDVRVRKALAHAVDRKAIIDNLYRGEAMLQNSLFVKHSLTIGYDEELAKNEPFPYNVKEAKDLLAAAGWADGFETQITTYDTTTSPGTPQMMEIVSEYLRQVGVKASVRFMEAGQYVGLFRDKALNGMGPISFGGANPDFATVYQNHYHKDAPFSYDNWEEGDAMWAKIQATIDPEEREQLSKELLRKLSRERVPNLTLVAPNALLGVGPKVKAYPRPPAQPYLSHLDHIELA
jgi:peptide/nickel transport system substrate-binding protein